MGTSVAKTGRGMSGRTTFIFQNTANQLGDIAVQASMGSNMFRVLGMQLPQIAGGFALLGGSLGVVAPILGVIAAIGFPILATMTSFGKSAGDAAEELNKVKAALDDLQGYDKLLEAQLVAPIDKAHERAQQLIDILRRKAFEEARGGLIKSLSELLQPFQDKADKFNRSLERTQENLNKIRNQSSFEDRSLEEVRLINLKLDQIEELTHKIRTNEQIIKQVTDAFRDSGSAQDLADNLLKARLNIAKIVPEAELFENAFDEIMQSSGLTELILARTRDTQIRITKETKEEAAARDRIVKRNRENFQVEASVAVQEQKIAELRAAFAKKQQELNKQEPLKKTRTQIKQLAPEIKNLKTAVDMIGSSFERSFMSAVTGTASVKDAFRSMAANIIAELFRIFVVKQITGFITNLATSAFVGAPQGPTLSGAPLPAYEGGGYTGSGSRTGGLDGRGGFMAMLHPNETVIDHTRGNSGGEVVVNQTINVTTGVQQTVRNEIQTLLPQIAEASKAAVLDARRRGGSFANAF
jgi:major membrane immunogen (membrane-anchored lipoprotein)